MSTSYTDVFTGKNITAAFPQYSAIDLTEDIVLSWPAQFQNTNNVVSVIMDITPNAPGRTVTMPDATEGSVGFAFTINFISSLYQKRGITPLYLNPNNCAAPPKINQIIFLIILTIKSKAIWHNAKR